jgi:hypothetical protein
LELNKIQELEIEQLKKKLENIRREFNKFKNLDTVPVDLPLKTSNDDIRFETIWFGRSATSSVKLKYLKILMTGK